MAYDSLHRYRTLYAHLLRLHPRPYYERFGEGMEQTFHDALRASAEGGAGVFMHALWMCVDTAIGIIREQVVFITMQTTRTVKFVLASLCLLFVPLFAEIFDVDGWDWHAGDFAIVAVLLIALGMSVAYATGPRTTKQRVIGFALVLLVLLTYVHLAVGIVDWLPLAGS